MSQVEDLEAIDHYMTSVTAQTPQASQIQSAWGPWYSGLGWWDKNVSSDTLAEARSRRNTFNIQNAVTEKQAEQVQAVIEHSADKEQIDLSLVLGKTSKEIAKNFKAPVAHPTIRKGSKNHAAIQDLQEALGLEVSGEYDARTIAAVKAFQKAHDLKADGITGPKTWAMLYGAASATTGAPPPVAVVDSTKQFPPAKMPPTKTSSGKGGIAIKRPPAGGKPVPKDEAPAILAKATPVKGIRWTPVLATGGAGAAVGGMIAGPPGAVAGGLLGTLGAAIGAKFA